MRAHALLSASGSHRWLACPPSARLEEKFPERDSPYASEGTLAHALGELQLLNYLQEIDRKEYGLALANIEGDAQYSPDMADFVAMYVDEVIRRYEVVREKDAEAELFIERRLDFSPWVPEGFGTGDACIIGQGHVEVIDLKYGRNVKVDPAGNPQLILYALGVYNDPLSALYEPTSVHMTIVQPRNGGIDSCEIPVGELLGWGEAIKTTADLAIKGEGRFHAGEHCRFCRASPACKTLAAHNLELAKMEFKDPDVLSDEEIADVLRRADDFTNWINKVKEYALKEAEGGRHWDGFKLVEGRSVRKIVDVDGCATALTEAGYTAIWKPKELITLTALEKMLGKKKADELIAPYIKRPQGKPTLVSDDDPRPVFNSAQADFEIEEATA